MRAHSYMCIWACEEAVISVALQQMLFSSMGKLPLVFLVWGKILSRRTWTAVR